MIQKIKGTISSLCKLWVMAKEYPVLLNKIARFEREIGFINETLRDAIDVHTDVHTQESSFVIVVARWKKTDFVKCYNVGDESVEELVNHLRHVQQRGRIGRIDAHRALREHIVREFKP